MVKRGATFRPRGSEEVVTSTSINPDRSRGLTDSDDHGAEKQPVYVSRPRPLRLWLKGDLVVPEVVLLREIVRF